MTLKQRSDSGPPVTEQKAASPAEMYDGFFGPALFAPWAAVLVDLAVPRPEDRVLDLACGTGIVARQVGPALGPRGRLVGVDVNADMLDVARRTPVPGGPEVIWQQGDAQALELPDATFDLVLCQQGLQFFPDRPAAAREMRRVLADDGRLAVSVWRGIEHHPLLAASTDAVARHLDAPASALDTPFSFGDAGDLHRLLTDVGFRTVEISARSMDAHFPSADTFMTMTTVAAAAVLPAYAGAVGDPETRAELVRVSTEATAEFIERYRDGDGLTFPWHAHLAVARP